MRTRNRWVRAVWSAWSAATQAWEWEREAACYGYATEEREWAELHPAPRYRDFLVSMAGGQCYA